MQHASEPVARRSQAERSSTMQQRLCEAAIELLSEVGYERLSTTMVSERAEVSRGAQTHHYPTKNDLLVAAFEHLLEGWKSSRGRLVKLHSGRITPETFIRFLWREIISKPSFIASLELMLASRGNADLRERLQAVLASWFNVRDRIWYELLGMNVNDPRNDTFIQLTNCVLRGMAVQASINPDPETNERLLDAWIDVANRLIVPATERAEPLALPAKARKGKR